MNNKPKNNFEDIALGCFDENIEFEPIATYDVDGDCVEFLARPDSFYAERIDDLVTVYYSQETDEIIGSLIKGVSKYCQKLKEKMPGFIIEIHEGSIMLGHLFLARMWESDMEEMRVIVYKKLQEAAERTNIRAPICKV